MSGSTTELGLATAVDADDNADYLTIGLKNALTTLDGLFNNVTGHNHSSAHQGGPITSIPAGSIPDGSITSAKIADGTIQTVDLADRSVTGIKLAQPLGDNVVFLDNQGPVFVDSNSRIFSSSRTTYFDEYNGGWVWRNTSTGSPIEMTLSGAGQLILGQGASPTPRGQLTIFGNGAPSWAGYANTGPAALTLWGGVLVLNDAVGGGGNGGVLMIGCAPGVAFAGLKGFLINGGGNTIGDLSIATRRATGDASLTEAMRITAAGVVDLSSASAVIPKLSRYDIIGSNTALTNISLWTDVAGTSTSVAAGTYLVTLAGALVCGANPNFGEIALSDASAGTSGVPGYLSCSQVNVPANSTHMEAISGIVTLPATTVKIQAYSSAAGNSVTGCRCTLLRIA